MHHRGLRFVSFDGALPWRLAQTRSTIKAMPWPTPMHIVHSA